MLHSAYVAAVLKSLSYFLQPILEQIILSQRVPANKCLMYSFRDKAECCSTQRFKRVFQFDYRIGIISILAQKKGEMLAVHRKHAIMPLCHLGMHFSNVFHALRPGKLNVLHFTTKQITSAHFALARIFRWAINCSRKCSFHMCAFDCACLLFMHHHFFSLPSAFLSYL